MHVYEWEGEKYTIGEILQSARFLHVTTNSANPDGLGLPAGQRLGPDPKLELMVGIDYDVSLSETLVRAEKEFNQLLLGTEHLCVISLYSYPIFKVGVRDAASPLFAR